MLEPNGVSDAQLRDIVRTSGDAVMICNTAGTIVYWNAGAVRVFGFSEHDALGQSLDIIIPERQRARHWEGFDRVVETGVSRYADGALLAVPALRKDGTRISVEFTITMVRDGGAVVGMAAIVRDVTETFNKLKALRAQNRSS